MFAQLQNPSWPRTQNWSLIHVSQHECVLRIRLQLIIFSVAQVRVDTLDKYARGRLVVEIAHGAAHAVLERGLVGADSMMLSRTIRSRAPFTLSGYPKKAGLNWPSR